MEKQTANGSLSTLLQNFDHSKLKKTDTSVMTVDGRRILETRDECGRSVVKSVTAGELGFVRGLAEDLQVGEILPGLIMASQDVAHSLEILELYGITHILNLATFVENIFPSRFTYKNIELRDLPTTHIIPHFDKAFEFIDAGREAGGVLVHCNAGISRAATVTVAYLMKTEHMSLKKAFDHVKKCRPSTSPNAGFMVQLETYGERLESEHDSRQK